MNKKLFYILSFTWGLPLTLIGLVVALVLFMTGHRAKKHGWCYYFAIGENWGGLELGIFFLCDKKEIAHTKNHEFGHGIQNCYFGFLMPFIVCIPSVIRYWYREIRTRRGKENKKGYDDIWFEGQATYLGTKYIGKNETTRNIIK